MPESNLQLDGSLPDNEVVFLYVEDESINFDVLFPYIQSNFSPQSRHAKSLKTATNLLFKEKFRPTLIIHDSGILSADDAKLAETKNGDTLYVQYRRMKPKIPVGVLTGDDIDIMRNREPYVDHPPLLGWISKPASQDQFHTFVERYRRLCRGEPIE